MAMLACARSGRSIRWCLAALQLPNWRPASTMRRPSWWCRPPAASSRAGSLPTSRCSTRPSNIAHQSLLAQSFWRGTGIAELKDRDFDYHAWLRPRAAGERWTALPVAHRSALHPLHIRHDRPAQGRGARQWRAHGGAELVDDAIYGVKPGEVFWAASDVGWVVGHSYIVYAPLLHGCTTIVFEGKPVGTPDAGTFWRVIEEHKVAVLFTAPTAFRAIKKEDPEGGIPRAKYDLSGFRRCSWPANVPIPTRSSGRRTCSRCR
jgi:hypothetical protein